MLKTKKQLVIFSVIIIALVAGGAGFILFKQSNNSNLPAPTSQPQQAEINLEPATAEDAARVDNNKETIVKQQEKDQAYQETSGGKKSVKPAITYAGVYGNDVEVGGYANVFEEGGQCTATFTLGSNKLSKTVAANRSAQSTDCPAMSLPVSDFA